MLNCSLCNQSIDIKQHQGLLINRKAELRSRLLIDNETLKKLSLKQKLPDAAIFNLQAEIVAMQTELTGLENG